ncbi:sterol desaturase family protein [Aquabacterium sp.]|uniref:sterol desaturase family protein n=1 Tax=Aquabacterium sp. TaxID=1872578 RepID=UPI0040379757
MTPLTDAFGQLQQWLFETAVQPAMFAIGMGNLLEDAYDATGWLLVGVIQLLLMLAVIAPLQRWRPVESGARGLAVRADVIYTLVHRLGLFRVAMFFSVEPLLDVVFGQARVSGLDGWQLDAVMAPWWPGVSDTAWASFVLYLVVFDLVDYWIHRGQHHFDRWWALHAVHHSQRHMTMWSDNRNHLLDDLIRDLIIAFTARAIGVPPGQFVAVVAVTQLIENLSHANTRVGFGWLGERLLVGPRFHRLHHAVGVGHEGAQPGTLGGCNFAVLFPVWDMLFGTARFDGRFEPTGIRDQLPEYGGRDYGTGFWAQQWLGLKRLLG